MKKMLGKMMALLLCAILVLTACDSKKDAPPDNTASPSGQNPPAATDEEPQAAEKDYSEHQTITVSSSLFLETGVDYMDDLSKEILKKFNATIEVVPVSASEMMDKNRIWISSGDMPDITYSSFLYADYAKFAEQGLVRPLPEDYETKYPHLAAAIAASGYDAPLKERHDGLLYGAPRPIFINKIVDPFAEHWSIFYRKDWAEELGLPVKDAYTLEELMTMAKAFMEKDPNGNGAGKTIGFAAEPQAMIRTFMLPFDSGYSKIYKKGDEYVFGPFQEGSLQGLKELSKYYEEGTVYKDFFTIKVRGEVESMFNAGITGIMNNGGAFGNVKRIFNEFGKENPDKNPLEVLEIANILGPDGKIHNLEFSNIQSISYFNPNMSDNKFERILDILDYVGTSEVQDMANMGFEGKDYTRDGDTITLTREKNKDGDFVPLADIYPSYYVWSQLVIAWDDFSVRDPSTNPKLLEKNIKMWKQRTDNGNLSNVDYDIVFYSSKPYDKLLSVAGNVNNDYTNIIVKSGDNIEQGFQNYINENKAVVEQGLNDVNAALVK